MKEIHNEKEFNDAISNNDVAVVKVGTECCGMCNVVENNIKQIENGFTNVGFYKVDAEECDQNLLDSELSCVESIPTVVFIKNKKLAAIVTGVLPVPAFKEKISKLL